MNDSKIKGTVQICEAVLAKASNTFPTSYRTYYGHALFTKAVRHGQSIISLCEAADPSSRNAELDVAAICILTRCIMEAHNAMAYLLEPGISKDEFEFRLHLFSLNHATDLRKIHHRLGISPRPFGDAARVWSLEELSRNTIFKGLDVPHQKKLLLGGSPYIPQRYRGDRPLSSTVESGLYNLFSQSTHSLSLGLTPFVGGGNLTAAGTENSFRLAVHAATIYLSTQALIYLRLRSRVFKSSLSQWKDALKRSSATEGLTKRLREISDGLEELSC